MSLLNICIIHIYLHKYINKQGTRISEHKEGTDRLMPAVKVLRINKDAFKENQAKKQDKCITAFRKTKRL